MGSVPEARAHNLAPEQRREVLRQAAEALGSQPRVRVAFAHGSFVLGTPFRDLDVAVWFDPEPHWSDPGSVADEVWRAIGRPPYPVDVHPLNDTPPAFRDQVCRTGTLLFERNAGDAADLATVAQSMLIDQREWLRVHREA